MENLPKEQWALVSTQKGKVQVKRIPVPVPESGQVLVKVEAAPLNPSDLYCLQGRYDDFDVFKNTYPCVAGWEGSGTVVASGGGMLANSKVGKTVSFCRLVKGNELHPSGCYGQYALADGMSCIAFDASIPIDVASMLFVNPLTAIGLVESIGKYKGKAAIQTGAAGQLGRMMCYLCNEAKIPLINVVRKQEQVDLLKNQYNQKYVLNSSTDTFYEDLKKLAAELQATVFIEAVGGENTGKVLETLPNGSTCVLYGLLSEQPPSHIDPLLFIGRNYTIQGWVLGEWIVSKGLEIISVIGRMNALMKIKEFQPTIQKKFTLSQAQDSIQEYYKNMTGGKFLLCPNMEDPELETKEFEEFEMSTLDSVEK